MSTRDVSAARNRTDAGWVRRLHAHWQPGPWNRDATWVTVVTVVLLLLGLLMSFSASFVESAEAGNPFAVFQRQLLWAAIGVPAFVAVANLHSDIWRRLSWPLLIVSLVGLALVLVPGIGDAAYGSTRWLRFGPIAVQPSEIAKLATLLWLADVLERKRPPDGRLHSTDHLLVPALPLLGVLGVLVLAQPDLGTTIVLALIVGALVWIEGLPARFVALAAGAGVLAVAALALLAPYRVSRVRGWLWPERDPLGEGFQLLQSKYALGSGGVTGIGLGQ